MKKIAAFIIGTVLGAGLWITVAELTGQREAWDGNLLYYTGSLLAAGSMIGFVFPRAWIPGTAGIYTGQMTAILAKSGGDMGLLPLGLIALMIFTSLSAAGGFICSLARTNQKRK